MFANKILSTEAEILRELAKEIPNFTKTTNLLTKFVNLSQRAINNVADDSQFLPLHDMPARRPNETLQLSELANKREYVCSVLKHLINQILQSTREMTSLPERGRVNRLFTADIVDLRAKTLLQVELFEKKFDLMPNRTASAGYTNRGTSIPTPLTVTPMTQTHPTIPPTIYGQPAKQPNKSRQLER